MPVYKVTFQMVDSYERQTSKSFESVTLADEATALTSAEALADALAALSGCRILYYVVGQEIPYTDAVTAGSNVDAGLTVTMRKVDNKKAPLTVPAPAPAIFDAVGNLITSPIPTVASDFLDMFVTGGDWTFSDGEQASEVVSGKLDK